MHPVFSIHSIRDGRAPSSSPAEAPHSYLFLNMTHGDLFLREKHDRIGSIVDIYRKGAGTHGNQRARLAGSHRRSLSGQGRFSRRGQRGDLCRRAARGARHRHGGGKVPPRAEKAHRRHERAQRAHAGGVSRRGVRRVLLRPDGRDNARAPAQLYFKYARHRPDDRAARVLRQGKDAGLFRHDPHRGGAARRRRGRGAARRLPRAGQRA